MTSLYSWYDVIITASVDQITTSMINTAPIALKPNGKFDTKMKESAIFSLGYFLTYCHLLSCKYILDLFTTKSAIYHLKFENQCNFHLYSGIGSGLLLASGWARFASSAN